MQPLWTDELLQGSLGEVLQSKAENSEWSKRLRKEVSMLVESRLSKLISHEEYESDRVQYKEDAAECKRRHNLLENEIASRDKSWRADAHG